MKIPFLRSLSVIVLAVFCTTGFLTAQQTAPAAGDKPAAQVPYCDDIHRIVKNDLQPRANLECRSVHKCIDCVERRTGTQTCVPVFVHPGKGSNCLLRAEVAMGDKPVGDAIGPNFSVEILRSVCILSGISLEAVVPVGGIADPPSAGRYAYEWQIDGGKIITDRRIECISGQEAKLKVTQLATGKAQTMSVRISTYGGGANANAGVTAIPKPLAVFKKTGCFGSCPVYSVEFYTDGSVVWNGLMNVSPAGRKTSKVAPAVIAKIGTMAEELRFFELDDKYPDDPIADASSTIIALNLNGRSKEVEHIFGGPDNLLKFITFFDDTIKQLGWPALQSPKTTSDKLNNNAKN